MPFSSTVGANSNLSTSAFGHHPEDTNFIASEVANNETESENSKIITEIDTKDTTITAINSEVTQHK